MRWRLDLKTFGPQPPHCTALNWSKECLFRQNFSTFTKHLALKLSEMYEGQDALCEPPRIVHTPRSNFWDFRRLNGIRSTRRRSSQWIEISFTFWHLNFSCLTKTLHLNLLEHPPNLVHHSWISILLPICHKNQEKISYKYLAVLEKLTHTNQLIIKIPSLCCNATLTSLLSKHVLINEQALNSKVFQLLVLHLLLM